MNVVLPQINFIWGSASTMSVTYTAVSPVRDETVAFLAGLLAAECLRRGTRADTRSLLVHDQAVLVLRWSLDGIRMSQLVRDKGIGRSTGYDQLHEGIDALADLHPVCTGLLLAAKAAGHSHMNVPICWLALLLTRVAERSCGGQNADHKSTACSECQGQGGARPQ
jgi:hypothetical protein